MCSFLEPSKLSFSSPVVFDIYKSVIASQQNRTLYSFEQIITRNGNMKEIDKDSKLYQVGLKQLTHMGLFKKVSLPLVLNFIVYTCTFHHFASYSGFKFLASCGNVNYIIT